MISDRQHGVAGGGQHQADSLLDMFAESDIDKAQLFLSKGCLADALAIYAKIGASQAERHYQDALILEQRNNLEGAKGVLKMCVSANPCHFPAWMKLAKFLSGLEAEKALRSALEVVPGNPEASVRLANLLIARNQRMEAGKTLVEVVPSASDSYDIQFSLANLLWQLGDFPAAEPHLRRCIQMNKDDIRPYQILLELLNRLDRVIDAEELCRDYLKFKPSDQLVRNFLAQTLVRQRRWHDAEAVFIELLVELPGSVPLRQIYADMLEKCSRMDEALAILQKNVEMTPHDPDVYFALADVLHKAGRVDDAFKTCRLIAEMYRKAENWGLHLLPNALETRLIFYQLGTIAEKYCTGQRAVFDNTGLNINQADFEIGEVVELFCVVMGREHIDYLEHVAYPALSSTEDFDNLLEERTVIYNIYTTAADLKLMPGFLDKLSSRGIRYRVNVELLAFSQDIYLILALPIIDQVKRSLALRSAVVMAPPDAIISGSIYRVLKDMKPFETVVCAMPRIDSAIAYPELKSYFCNAAGNGLDSREFVRKSMTDFIHPQTYSALASENGCLRYRDEGTYYAAKNWAPPPLCFYAREEMLDHMIRHPLCGPKSIASFYAIDHDFVDSAYRTGNLRLISDSDYFFWAEFTHPGRHTDFLAGRKAEDYYYPESTRQIFKHEFKWIYGN